MDSSTLETLYAQARSLGVEESSREEISSINEAKAIVKSIAKNKLFNYFSSMGEIDLEARSTLLINFEHEHATFVLPETSLRRKRGKFYSFNLKQIIFEEIPVVLEEREWR